MKTRYIELAAAALLTIACAGSARAHATFETPTATVNSYYKAVLQVPHGCKGEPTLKVRVEIPEGIIAVKPMPKAGWKLETKKADYANKYEVHGSAVTSGVKEIIWTGTLEDEHFDQFVFQARITDKLPVDANVYFPTTQECANGKVAWIDIPAAGQDPHSVKSPAPGLMITAAQTHGGHDHGAAMAHGAEYKLGDLTISTPFIRATPPNAPVSGGFMLIKNAGAQPDRLIGGSADFADKFEVHEMKMEGDVMKMRPVEGGIEIPAGGEVVLKPGGYHVMFMNLKEQLKIDEKRKVKLVFQNAGEIEIEFNVQEVKAGHDMQHGNHDMGKQGMNSGHGSDDPAEAIPALMKAQFETPEMPLTVQPVVVDGEWAIAGWQQESRGGRGLLHKGEAGWYIHMCGGEGFKHAKNLAQTGMPHDVAMSIAASLKAEEEKLGSEVIAKFDSFEGVVEVGPGGHHDHGGHDKAKHGTQGG